MTRDSQTRAALCGVMMFAALMVFVRAGSAPLIDPDESRFAQTSVEMLETGDVVVPRFGGEPRLVKPPMLHWIQSRLFALVGVTPWVARLPAALAALGSIALVALIAARRFGAEAAPWAAAIQATMPLAFVPARVGTLDALLSVHVLAIVAIDMIDLRREQRFREVAIGALAGLAFLIKGPVGVLLPLLVMLAGRTAAGRDTLPTLGGFLRGSAAWSVVVLPWGLAFADRIGWSETVTLLRTESLERYFAPPIHAEPFWYYGPLLVVGLLPWTPLVVAAFVRAWRERDDPGSRSARYAAAGLVAGVVFFSVARSKLATYVVPLVPLASLLLTWELGRQLAGARRSKAFIAGTLGAGAVLLAVAASTRLSGPPATAAWTGAALWAVGAAIAIGSRTRAAWGAAAASTLAFLTVVAALVFPVVGSERSSGPLVQTVPALASERPVVTVEIQVPSLTFYGGRPPEVIGMDALASRIDRPDRPVFVLADVDMDAVPAEQRSRLREIGRHAKLIAFEEFVDWPGGAE